MKQLLVGVLVLVGVGLMPLPLLLRPKPKTDDFPLSYAVFVRGCVRMHYTEPTVARPAAAERMMADFACHLGWTPKWVEDIQFRESQYVDERKR